MTFSPEPALWAAGRGAQFEREVGRPDQGNDRLSLLFLHLRVCSGSAGTQAEVQSDSLSSQSGSRLIETLLLVTEPRVGVKSQRDPTASNHSEPST